jgi:hypothetical protein
LVPGRHETPVRSIPHHRTGYRITFFAAIKKYITEKKTKTFFDTGGERFSSPPSVVVDHGRVVAWRYGKQLDHEHGLIWRIDLNETF